MSSTSVTTATPLLPTTINQTNGQLTNSPSRRSRTPYIMLVLGLLLTVIFIFVVVIYFYLRKNPNVHEILVKNQCPTAMNVLLNSGSDTLGASVPAGAQYSYFVTPGFKGHITASAGNNGPLCQTPTGLTDCPFTQARLALATNNVSKVEMRTQDGSFVNLPLVDPILEVNTYGISLAKGYNINMSITGTSNTSGVCNGPTFVSTITEDTCPTALRYVDSNNNYIGCASACTNQQTGISGNTGDFCCTNFDCTGATTCQNNWVPSSFYNTFGAACPNCLITNCDTPNYTCNNADIDALVQYTVTLCAPVNS